MRVGSRMAKAGRLKGVLQPRLLSVASSVKTAACTSLIPISVSTFRANSPSVSIAYTFCAVNVSKQSKLTLFNVNFWTKPIRLAKSFSVHRSSLSFEASSSTIAILTNNDFQLFQTSSPRLFNIASLSLTVSAASNGAFNSLAYLAQALYRSVIFIKYASISGASAPCFLRSSFFNLFLLPSLYAVNTAFATLLNSYIFTFPKPCSLCL